jgi:hypothetical protein
MTEFLYIELLEEGREPDSKSPTGYAIVMVPSGKCAVFDEKEFDEQIQKTLHRLRELKKLRKEAVEHSGLIAEAYLKSFGVPFKVQTLVKKQS